MVPAVLSAQTPARFGFAVAKADNVCLSIRNTDIAEGSRIHLIVVSQPQSVAQAIVEGKRADTCGERQPPSAHMNHYGLKVVSGELHPLEPAIAFAGKMGDVTIRDGMASAVIDGNRDYFRSCTSQEGVHLTVWSGRPLEGRRIWHAYYYLDYDVDPTCTPKDTAPSAGSR